MTDEKIIKALECCKKGDGSICRMADCPLFGTGDCFTTLAQNALSLINRQQAEIERLSNHLPDLTKMIITKFAERVKMAFYYEFDELIPSIMSDKIDELVTDICVGGKTEKGGE